ncbi:integrase, catalytic region, zinc finger, CCHC-type containing protein, partial [Tanacetum coccineum]
SELKNKLQTVDKGKTVNTKFDKSETSGTLLCVTPLPKNIAVKAKKVSTTKVNTDRSKPVTSHLTPKQKQSQKHNENVLARGMYRITKTETRTPDSKTNINVCNYTGVESSNSIRREKSKDTKSKDRVLKNKNDKRPSTHVRKMSSSVSIDSNKRETMHSNVCQSNASVLSTKTVNDVSDGSNIVCVSCGKYVFLLSHEKCVAHYALSRNSSVKRALFTTPIAAKSKNLGATSVVAKSRLSVAKTTTATNKVIHLVFWIVDRECSKYMTGNLQQLRNFVKKFMGTVRFRNDHFVAITRYGDYVQGNLTISCEQGKSKKASCPPKLVPSTESKLELLHMDLCGPMRVASINSKKYILVIVDDHSWYTWVYFLRTKDEASYMIIDFINQVQRNLKAQILTIRTDNGTELKNEKLRAFYEKLGIVYKTSIPRTPQQNGVVERRNRTLVKAARTMLIFSKTP